MSSPGIAFRSVAVVEMFKSLMLEVEASSGRSLKILRILRCSLMRFIYIRGEPSMSFLLRKGPQGWHTLKKFAPPYEPEHKTLSPFALLMWMRNG